MTLAAFRLLYTRETLNYHGQLISGKPASTRMLLYGLGEHLYLVIR